MKLTRIAVDNPVFATMMMVALLVMGLFSYRQLGIDQFPNVDFPIVVVTTNYPGAAPETVESEISRKVEEAVNAVAGIKTLSSRSLEGQSIVIAEFELSVPSAVALQDVREKVQQVRASFPARGQGTADSALRPGRPAGHLDRGALGHPLGAGPDDARRPGHRQAPADGPRRRQRQDRRRRQAPDQHRARSRPHAFAARWRQRRHEGGAGGEPELPRRQRAARQRRSPGRGHRTHRRARQLRRPHRRPARPCSGLSARDRHGGRRRAGARERRPAERRARPCHRHRQDPGRQHHRRGPRRAQGRGRAAAHPAARREARDRARRLARHPELGRQRAADDGRGRPAHHRHRLPVPAFLAQHGDHRAGAADLGVRLLHGDGRLRLHAECADADGASASPSAS